MNKFDPLYLTGIFNQDHNFIFTHFLNPLTNFDYILHTGTSLDGNKKFQLANWVSPNGIWIKLIERLFFPAALSSGRYSRHSSTNLCMPFVLPIRAAVREAHCIVPMFSWKTWPISASINYPNSTRTQVISKLVCLYFRGGYRSIMISHARHPSHDSIRRAAKESCAAARRLRLVD
jgi:hypothetical protein